MVAVGKALFGELSWFGAKGAMEAAEREGLLSEEATAFEPFYCRFELKVELNQLNLWVLAHAQQRSLVTLIEWNQSCLPHLKRTDTVPKNV